MADFFNKAVKNVDSSEVEAFSSTSDSTIILSILCANTDGTSSQDVTVQRKDASSTDKGYLAFTVPIPADSNFDVLGNKYILPSGDSIFISCSSSGTVDASFSYVVV